MQHRVAAIEKAPHDVSVGDIAEDDIGGRGDAERAEGDRDALGAPREQSHLVTSREEGGRGVRADEAGGACDGDLHSAIVRVERKPAAMRAA